MSEKKYNAPALVKGLEILQLLAPKARPMTLSEISESLGRSKSQIFRMVQELESMAYIERDSLNDGYTITNKLFLLGLESPRTLTLLEAALPEMTAYSESTQQSCHIAIRADFNIVVIARREGPGPVSFSVKVGHSQKLWKTSSGVILTAWMDPSKRSDLVDELEKSYPDFDQSSFFKHCQKVHARGFEKRDSRFIKGVTDLSAPIIRGNYAVASLTSPCVRRLDDSDNKLPVKELIETADQISRKLRPV